MNYITHPTALRSPIGRHPALVMAITILALLSGGADSKAQQWEYVYGVKNCDETGYNRVRPVTNCGGGGFIAVGYSSVSTDCEATDAYVVRTNNNGTRMWEMTYAIGDHGHDTAFSIVELANGTGFVVVGVTNKGSGCAAFGDIFLMKIDCNGAVVWINTYGSGSAADIGMDVIEATTGTAPTTSAGDLVVCGWTYSGNPATENALLMRTTSTGVFIWDAVYDHGTAEKFWALTEAVPTATQTTADIIACGASNSFGPALGKQGYIVRASGNNGSVTPGPGSLQNVAWYGGTGNEEFYSVVELQQTFVGDLVLAGYTTTTTNGNSDVYLLETAGNPCTPVTQTRIGLSTDEDTAYCVREIGTASTAYALGQLAITGSTEAGETATDVFFLASAPGTLGIVGLFSPLQPQVYGDHADQYDGGRSLEVVTAGTGNGTSGFILCGYSQNHPVNSSDPLDMYLIKIDSASSNSSGCEIPWVTDSVDVNFNNGCPTPVVTAVLVSCGGAAVETEQDLGIDACPPLLQKDVPLMTIPPDRETLDEGTMHSPASITPNPVRRGTDLVVMLPARASATELSVVDLTGEVIYGQALPHSSSSDQVQVVVDTKGMLPGSYTIVFGSSGTVAPVRVVITN